MRLVLAVIIGGGLGTAVMYATGSALVGSITSTVIGLLVIIALK